MAITPDKKQVDFSSQIQVTGRSGLGSAAGYEQQIANNWSQIGNEFKSFMIEELKARNIENAISLANQIQYDETTIEADVDGRKISAKMPSLIAPEGKIVGQSGLDAYKKIAAKTYLAELENDFATITETEANIAEDQKLTMQQYTANVTEKHNLIYEALPPDIVNAVRPEMEKKLIQRAARVQNTYLAFQNANQQDAYVKLSSDYKDKIVNLSNIGDADAVRKMQEKYFEHLEDGLALGNIKGLTPEYIQQERARVNGETSFRLMLSQFSVKELDSRNINHVRAELNNLTNLIDMLTPVPGVDKATLVNPYTGETLQISAETIKEMIPDPQTAEKIAVDLKTRRGHYSNLMNNVDSSLDSIELANSLISSRNASVQHRPLTDADVKKLTTDQPGYATLVHDYNKNYGANLGVKDSITNSQFQQILVLDYGVMTPDFKKTMTANLNTMDVEYLDMLWKSGFLSKMKSHKVQGKGGRATRVNLFEKYFGELADNFTRFTRALEQGEDIRELAQVYNDVKSGVAMSATEVESYIKDKGGKLPATRTAIYNAARASYEAQFPGVDNDRIRAYADGLVRDLQSDSLTRSLYASGNFNIDDDIYDKEASRQAQYSLVKSGYTYNPSGIDAHRAGHQEMYIARNQALMQFALPPVVDGEFDYTKEWNLDYMKDFIRMWMMNDPNTNWKTQFDVEDIGEYIDKEWRVGGKIKVIPVSNNQKYPTYRIVHLNVDGAPTYVTDASLNPKEFNIGDIFQPAYKNIASNEQFRSFIMERANRGADGKVTDLSPPDIDSLWYKVGREANQLYKSIDILPDENWTVGETVAAGGAGIVAPYVANALAPVKDLIKKGAKKLIGKSNVSLGKEAKKAIDIVKGKDTGKLGWKGRAALAISFYIGSTVFSRELEAFQQGFSVAPYDIKDMQHHMRYQNENDIYPTRIPEWAVQAFDPDIDTYKFEEEYTNEFSEIVYPKGSEGTMLLSAEIHDNKWIVFPSIRVVDGKRILLSKEDAFKEAVDKKDFIEFGPSEDPVAKNKAIDFSRNYGHEVNWWRQNPNVMWWAKGVVSDR